MYIISSYLYLLSNLISNPSTNFSSSLIDSFIESRTMNLLNDEMVFAEEDYFDSDDEIEVDESLYDP